MKLSTPQDRTRYIAFLRGQALPLDVQCSPWKATRSNEQNAYLWRAVYQPLVEVAGFTKDDWHEHFCGERWGWIEHVKPSGVIEMRPARTTTRPRKLSKDEFRLFVDWVEQQAAERGVFVSEEWQG